MRHNYSFLGLLSRVRSPQNFSHFELRRFPKLIPLLRQNFASLLSNDETYLGTHHLCIFQFQSSHKTINRGFIQKSLLSAPAVSLSFSLRSVTIYFLSTILYKNITL
jgi:hypothetical protein